MAAAPTMKPEHPGHEVGLLGWVSAVLGPLAVSGILVVFRDHSVDRSPCGSCFSALMAQLHATRKLRLDEWVECENLLGLFFRGRLVDRGGELIPQLSGSAFITGEHRFRIDSRDPLRHGFQLA